MQIWQIFITLKQPVHTAVTVFSNLKKLSNFSFIFYLLKRIYAFIHSFIHSLQRSSQKMEGLLVNKRDLLALYLSGTYCHKTGTRPLAVVLSGNQLYIQIIFWPTGIRICGSLIKNIFILFALLITNEWIQKGFLFLVRISRISRSKLSLRSKKRRGGNAIKFRFLLKARMT